MTEPTELSDALEEAPTDRVPFPLELRLLPAPECPPWLKLDDLVGADLLARVQTCRENLVNLFNEARAIIEEAAEPFTLLEQTDRAVDDVPGDVWDTINVLSGRRSVYTLIVLLAELAESFTEQPILQLNRGRVEMLCEDANVEVAS
jgi:hypothetical protein